MSAALLRLIAASSLLVAVRCASTAKNLGASSAATLRASKAPSVDDFFAALSEEEALASVWRRAPTLWQSVSGAADLFCFDDAVAGAEGGLLERACVALGDAAARGNWVSEYAAPGDRAALEAALRRGTVFFNGAGLDYPKLAALAARAQATLGLPCNANVYLTDPGREVSVSPHTDAQDVLVFQTAGRKRWRVWRPPPRRRGVDPFGRGKRGDAIAPAELDEPLLDAWLEPGDVLYVPIGFPHATSTEACDAVSCHVTLGLDTYFYGLCYATLRAVAIARAGGRDGVDSSRLDDALHDRLFAPLPLGFLNDGALDDAGLVDRIVDDVAALNADVAAACGVAAPSLGDAAAVRRCADFF